MALTRHARFVSAGACLPIVPLCCKILDLCNARQPAPRSKAGEGRAD
jgi:hypothetical protein